jgi:hypothetical protein
MDEGWRRVLAGPIRTGTRHLKALIFRGVRIAAFGTAPATGAFALDAVGRTGRLRRNGHAGIRHSHHGVSHAVRVVFQRIVDSANAKLGLEPHSTR